VPLPLGNVRSLVGPDLQHYLNRLLSNDSECFAAIPVEIKAVFATKVPGRWKLTEDNSHGMIFRGLTITQAVRNTRAGPKNRVGAGPEGSSRYGHPRFLAAIEDHMTRTLYVDGFNFYYGVTRFYSRNKKLAGLGWCNFRSLIERNFPDQGKLTIKYFTAPVTQAVELPGHRAGEHSRYELWIRALRTIGGVIVIRGKYKPTDDTNNPDRPRKKREEKQTDVNLALEMVLDAFAPPAKRPEHVFVLSNDCDLMPAIFTLQERVPVPPRITVLLPSEASLQAWQSSWDLTRHTLKQCHRIVPPKFPQKPIEVKMLRETMLANSLLGYSLQDAHGQFSCPHYWTLPPEYLDQQCQRRDWRPDLSPAAQTTVSVLPVTPSHE
jgi:hypothetical protein